MTLEALWELSTSNKVAITTLEENKHINHLSSKLEITIEEVGNVIKDIDEACQNKIMLFTDEIFGIYVISHLSLTK